ncbi:hypothetical protein [Dyella monticola]|uniref:DUF7931 domain-containing protein n=1 Tax=Dyella monticola TaxID=1927958 RepID=UPI001E37E1E9|nr:hypothetical protein [Dyella monticola]
MNTPITSQEQNDGVHAVSGPGAVADVRLQLLQATRYKLAIYLPNLPATAFSTSEELAELRRIGISGRGAEIRVVLGDPDTALREGHRLIDLAQRLPSVLRIRTPIEEDQNTNEVASAWMLNDTSGYLLLPDADRWEGRAALRDGPGHAPLLLKFEQIWERAQPASGLQPLGL